METRHTRFELRFDKGGRAGERIALEPGVHGLGRAEENAIRLVDGSVSARHAELVVTADEVRVVDRGSTNGTRVGGRRVESVRLAHGDRLSLGNVEVVLVDHSFETAVMHSAGPSDGARAPRRRRRSRWPLLALALVLLAALGLGWWKLRARERAESAPLARSVVEIPGNQLPDGSFESEEAPAWEAAAAAPRALRRGARYARSGVAGLGVELGADEWSFFRSPPVPVNGARALRLVAALRAEDTGGASEPGTARIGIERLAAGERLVSWSAPAETPVSNGDFESLELVVPCAPGWSEARVVLAARGPGTFSLDDVGVVRASELPAAAVFLEDELQAAGERPTSLAIVRGGRTVLEAALSGWSEDGLRGPGTGWLEARAIEDGFQIGVRESGPDGAGDPSGSGETLALSLEASGEEPWAATLSPSGFRQQKGELSADDATDVILGAGNETVRVALGRERVVGGRLDGARLRLRVPIADGDLVRIQLRFRAELIEAEELRERALAAEAHGEPSEALARWSELLARVPLRGAAVREAQAASARLVATGWQEIEQLRRAIARARFFALPELYGETLRAAEKIAFAYRGTELEPIAAELSAELTGELQGAARRTAEEESERMRAVLRSQQVAGSSALSERLQAELERLARAAPAEEEGR